MRIVIERNVYTRKETQASTQSYCCLGWYTRTATINNGSMKKRKKSREYKAAMTQKAENKAHSSNERLK